MIFYFHVVEQSRRRASARNCQAGLYVCISVWKSSCQRRERKKSPLGDKGWHHLPTRLLKNGERLSTAAGGSWELWDPGDRDIPRRLEQPGGGSELLPMAAGRPASASPSGLSPLKRKNMKGPGSGAWFGWEMMVMQCSVFGKMGIFGE